MVNGKIAFQCLANKYPSFQFLFERFQKSIFLFLDASVGWSIGPSVKLSSKSMKNGLLRIPNDFDNAGRGRMREEEEGGTRRKKGRGGRRDEEEGGTGRKDGEEGGTRRVKE